MKVISIWQPFATLTVKGFKFFETRTWPAPASLIGQTIGIASTKNIKPEQRAWVEEDNFQRFYQETGLPPLEELPCGYLLGTVKLDSCDLMTDELLDDVTDEEKAYGFWELGNYGWRQTHPVCFEHPIPIQGKQGIYDFYGFEPDRQNGEIQGRPVGAA
jgi:hypothetical protein